MERKKEGEKEGKEERKRIDWHGSYSPTSCYMTINIEVLSHLKLIMIGSHGVVMRDEEASMEESTTEILPNGHVEKLPSKYLFYLFGRVTFQPCSDKYL